MDARFYRSTARDELPRNSIFDSLAEASAFFEGGSVGYSPASKAGRSMIGAAQ